MSDQTAIQTEVIDERKKELEAMGHEIQTLLPGGEKLSRNQAISLGNVAKLTGASPWRGEIYGYADKEGNMKITEGYKLLVRWAKKISEYDEKYFPLTDAELTTQKAPPGSIGFRCRILRHDKWSGIKEYMSLGATFNEAIEEVATSAVGVVDKKEMYYRDGNPIPPPKGWTWAQVAEKRALKNALNFAYAMPSLKELEREYYGVGNTETEEEDWEGVEIYRTTDEQREAAKVNAWHREAQENPSLTPEQVKAATAAMRNNGDDDPLDLSPEDDAIGDEPEEGEYTDLPAGDPDFTPFDESGEWDETTAALGDESEPDTIVYDGPERPRDFFDLINEERKRHNMKPFEELKDLSSFLKTRNLTDGSGAWPKATRTWGLAYQAATSE